MINNFDELIKNGYVLVDFFATWCGPCKMMSPILESVSHERNDIEIIKVDVDMNEEVARKYGVMSIPTLILFKNGEIVGKHIGFLPKENVNSWIEENK